jgi:hypothetical protein
MLIEVDAIPWFHNILATFFTWILLAGFIIFPGTFTSINPNNKEIQAFQVASEAVEIVKNTSLLYISGVCCLIGAFGILWLWQTWKDKYTWLLSKIFLCVCIRRVTFTC